MKILHINTTASRGGAALIAKRLHLWQREAGYESSLLVARDPTDVGARILSLNETRNRFLMNVLGYRVLGREGLLNGGLWKKFHLEIGEADVVHIHNAHGYYMPEEVLSSLLFKPVVWTLHDFWLATGGVASPEVPEICGKGYPTEWINRSKVRRQFLGQLVAERNPVLVAPTRSCAEKLREIGLSASNLHVVHHGIFDSSDGAVAFDRRGLRSKLGWQENTHVFIFAASAVDNKQKGFDVFLSALSKLPKDRKWIAYVAGGDAGRSKRMVQNQGVLGIQFVGALENRQLRELFKACDTYVTSTYSETYGLTVVEALGEGATVLCSDLPVLREVTNGAARYFPVGDRDVLARCLMEELQGGGDAKRASRSKDIRNRFSKDNMVASYARLYALAIDQRLAAKGK